MVVAGSGQVQATPSAYQRPPSGCPPVFGFFSVFTLSSDDGFVLKLSPGSAAPLFLATIGGACQDSISRLALDSGGDIWVTGRTFSSDFSTVAPLPNLGSGGNSVAGFLVALDPAGTTLLSASISSGVGAVAAGPGGTVDYAEPLPVPDKTGSAVLIGRIDANLHPPIALDTIRSFGPGLPLGPAYVPFVIAPGEAVRLIGRGIGPVNPADASAAPGHVLPGIAGVQVTFNGIAAELVSVQANQIVCFVPFALDGAVSANVQVAYAGLVSNLYSIPVVPQNIDIVAVANPDGSLNSESNPAPVDSVVAIYLTGVGQTNPPSTDGALNTVPFLSPRRAPPITVNGAPEQPVFLGAAVGQVAGVMQVNLFVPDPGADGLNDAVYIGSAFLRIWTRSHP